MTDLDCSSCRRQHEHGELATYNSAKHLCRCSACREASAKNRRGQRKDRVVGVGPRTTDVRPVLRRLHVLRSRGLTIKRIAELAGMSARSISEIANLRDATGRKIHRDSARAIMAIIPPSDIRDVSETMKAPARGTRVRLQALQALGWSIRSIAQTSGLGECHLTTILEQRPNGDRITARTIRLVAQAYEELWDSRPAQETPAQRAAVSRTLNRAERAGWKPPMAHDDAEIDEDLPRVTLYRRKQVRPRGYRRDFHVGESDRELLGARG